MKLCQGEYERGESGDHSNSKYLVIVARDWNPGFEKPGPRGNPAILPNPKPGLRAAETRVSGLCFSAAYRCFLYISTSDRATA